MNEKHFERIETFLEEGVEVVYGGQRDKKELFFAPTIVKNANVDLKCMQEEIFGPILPITLLETEDDALEFVNSRPKPLSLYVFSNSNSTIKKWRENTSSGSFVANEAVLQGGLPTLPFGGVGESGTGSYHGKFSFNAFTHHKACLEAPTRMVETGNYKLRYPPYSEKKLSWARYVIFGKGGSCSVM